MAKATLKKKSNDSVRSFSAGRDENGQGMSGNPADRARPDDIHGQLMQEPAGDAQAAMLASGFTSDDATEATEAETPPENIAHIGDASLPSREELAKALDRATAPLGKK